MPEPSADRLNLSAYLQEIIIARFLLISYIGCAIAQSGGTPSTGAGMTG